MEKTSLLIGMLEDNREEALETENFIHEVVEECGISATIVFSSTNYESFLKHIQNDIVNICFLDIDINNNKINGMNIAEMIDSMDKGIKIVFLTGYDSYMNKAFKVSAFDYLLKPLNKEELRRTLVRLHKKLRSNKDCLEISAQEYIRIPYKDIVCLIYEDRRVKIITTESVEVLPSTYTLQSVISLLPEDRFVECSSWACVNMEYVKRFRGAEIELSIPGIGTLKNEYGLIDNKVRASQSGVKRIRKFLRML